MAGQYRSGPDNDNYPGIARYAQGEWTLIELSEDLQEQNVWGSFDSVCACGEDDIYASGMKSLWHYDGAMLSEVEHFSDWIFYEIECGNSDDIYLKLSDGVAWQEGSEWTMATNPVGSGGGVSGIHLTKEPKLFVTFDSAIVQLLDGELVSLNGFTNDSFSDLHGNEQGNIYMIGSSEVVTGKESSWEILNNYEPFTPEKFSIWYFSDNDVWISKISSLIYYDGNDWENVECPPSGTPEMPYSFSVRDILGTTTGDIYLVSSFGRLYLVNNEQCELLATTPLGLSYAAGSGRLSSVWGFGSSGNDIFLGGYEGIFHFDGNSWSSVVGSWEGVEAIWGFSAEEVYAIVRDEAERTTYHLMRYDGEKWQVLDVELSGQPTALWGHDANSFYIVGGGGLIMKADCN